MTTFLFKAKSGKPNFGSEFNEARLRQHLKENEGKVYRIEPEVNTRSLSQNKLYWKFLGVIEFETGQNADDMHEYFRRKLLLPKFITVNGEEIKIPRSTTELSKTEFGEYMEKISAMVDVPIPDTLTYLQTLDLAPYK